MGGDLIECIKAVHFAQHRVDFRKQFSGLLGEAYGMGLDPKSGDCVVFVNKDRSCLKAIVGDDLGLFLVVRKFYNRNPRLLASFMDNPAFTEITRAELELLFQGAYFRVIPWKK
jgi:hypothetical protein